MIIYTSKDYNNNSKELAELCLKDYFGYSVAIAHDGNGRPYAVAHNQYLSISHSGHYFVIAISEFEVGLDIEVKKNRNFQLIARKILPTKKILDIDHFYLEWTKLESNYKSGILVGEYKYFDIFKDCAMSIFSKDIQYLFIPIELLKEVNNDTRNNKRILSEQLGINSDEITLESRLVEDLHADSIDKAELVIALEEEFDIDVDFDKAMTVKTISDIKISIEEMIK